MKSDAKRLWRDDCSFRRSLFLFLISYFYFFKNGSSEILCLPSMVLALSMLRLYFGEEKSYSGL